MGHHTIIKSSRKKTLNVLIQNFDKKSEVLNWEGLKFTVNLSDINKFENHNSSIYVNVFSYQILVYPPTISAHNYKRESTVNLLIIVDDTKQHYCLIKDTGKLLSIQTSKYGYIRHVCIRCLNTFSLKESLTSHHEYCKSYEAITIELPEEGSTIYLKNHNRSMRVQFIVDADFESFTPQLSIFQPNPEKSYTNRHQKHIPSGFCYHIKFFDDTLYSQQPATFVKELNDDDIAQIFIDTL